jgi:hypothetical protein
MWIRTSAKYYKTVILFVSDAVLGDPGNLKDRREIARDLHFHPHHARTLALFILRYIIPSENSAISK